MEKKYKIIFVLDLILILFIPLISEIFTKSSGVYVSDYLVPYIAHYVVFLTIAILIGAYCIKKDTK